MKPVAAQTWARIGHSAPHVSAQSRIRPHMTGLCPGPTLTSSGPISRGGGRSRVRTWVGLADGLQTAVISSLACGYAAGC